jgi:hypothetical protein
VQWKAWQEACRRFHSSYDALAFPAGLGNAMSADFNDAESSSALRFAQPRFRTVRPNPCALGAVLSLDLQAVTFQVMEGKSSHGEELCLRFGEQGTGGTSGESRRLLGVEHRTTLAARSGNEGGTRIMHRSRSLQKEIQP